MKHSVLIVGGTGSVGSRIGRILSHRADMRIILAARRIEEAQAVAGKSGAAARVVDLQSPASWDAALVDVDLVVVCMDQNGPDFARKVLSSGIRYVDVTAGDAFFRSVEGLPPEDVRAAALLSVGLAPGLTNLLAADAASALDRTDRIDIGLLLGLGDIHGEAAMRWTLRQIFSPRAVASRMVDFGRHWGRRRTHWMDFADQHALRRTMPGVWTATRMAFDLRWMTAVIFAAGSLFRGSAALQELLLRVSPIISFGADACVIVAEASGMKDGRPAQAVATFHGRREADLTASVAAAAAVLLLEKEVGKGVFHIHQVFGAAEVAARLVQGEDQPQFSWPAVMLDRGEETLYRR